jgi:hypothetical protein
MQTQLRIVGRGDVPLFEAKLTPCQSRIQKEDLIQFILYSALDNVDQKARQTSSMFLGNVDKFNDVIVSAFTTASSIRFLLLHDQRLQEDSIKNFFIGVHELVLRIMLNPFYREGDPIENKVFAQRVGGLASKYLR